MEILHLVFQIHDYRPFYTLCDATSNDRQIESDRFDTELPHGIHLNIYRHISNNVLPVMKNLLENMISKPDYHEIKK